MTSEAKIAANRRNAQRSTGPRTAAAKARVRRNALQHGLAAIALADPTVTAEVDRVATSICGPGAGALEREQALIVAEAQVTLKQIRRARAAVMDLGLPIQNLGVTPSVPPVERCASCIDQLLRLERYERRALAQRKRAVRVTSRPD